MSRRNVKDTVLQMMQIVFCVATLACAVLVLVFKWEELDNENLIFALTGIVLLIEVIFLVAIQLRKYTSKDEMYALKKLLEYGRKRKEIEEEINLLTRTLMHSSVSEYLDVNRLAFAGQPQKLRGKSFDYESFLNQFGLVEEKIEVRKNSAVFLTPFTKEGEEIFNECQRVLGGIDIFLQKTDNFVEKDDIMMNIISLIVQSEIVIVNINGRNPNVYYELGIAHAIGKPTILISKSKFSLEEIGFDIRQKRIIMYDSLLDLEKQLLYQINRFKNK